MSTLLERVPSAERTVSSRGELDRLWRLITVAAHRNQALIAQHARVARQAERQDLIHE